MPDRTQIQLYSPSPGTNAEPEPLRYWANEEFQKVSTAFLEADTRLLEFVEEIEASIPPPTTTRPIGSCTVTTDGSGNPTVARQDGNLVSFTRQTDRTNVYYRATFSISGVSFTNDVQVFCNAEYTAQQPGTSLHFPVLIGPSLVSVSATQAVVEIEFFNLAGNTWQNNMRIWLKIEDQNP